jgi:hypothetical protein
VRAFGMIMLLWLSSGLLAGAQFFATQPKTFPLVVEHPPQFELSVKRIAFARPGGACSGEASELVDRMILPDFQQGQIDVVEREVLDQIMTEHNFNQSSYADAGSAAQLGRLLGPSAMIIVNVDTCRPEQQALFRDDKAFLSNNVVRTFISKTRFSLEGSLRIVDLTTGRLLGSHNFESKPEKANESQQGQPEYPPVDELKDNAMEAVKSQVHAMFFPYGDPINLVFYDDKDCDLKQIFDMYKNGDRDGAYHLADQDLQQCKSSGKKEKTLARAYYDAGVLHCLNRDYEGADALFKSAMDSKGADAVGAAESGCQQARAAESQLKAYRARFDQIPAPSPINPAAQAVSPQPATAQGSAPLPSQAAGPAPTPSGSNTPSVEDRLKKLDSLLKQGLITKQEYDKKKADILKAL